MRITVRGNAADAFSVQGRSFEVATGPVQEWGGPKAWGGPNRGVIVHPAREAKGELSLREFARVHRLAAGLVRISPHVRHKPYMGSASFPDSLSTLEIEVGNSPPVAYEFTLGHATTPAVTNLMHALQEVRDRLLPDLPGRARAI